MALSRKLLESMGLESDKVASIIEAHAETVDGLKAKLKEAEANSEKYEETAKALEKAQKELETYKEAGGDWQKKYEKEHSDFEAYKTEQTEKELTANKKSAYRKLLKDSGISEKAMELILKSADINAISLENDGSIKDAKTLQENIKKEYADFIVSTHTSGTQTQTPPGTSGGAAKTKEEIMKIKDPVERQKAIQDNPEAFGY